MTKLADCQVVGALTLPEGKAPFDRAPLILSSTAEPGRVVQVTAYLEDGGIAGKWFGVEDFEALQQSGQAIAFRESFGAGAGAALWVLRPNFAGREAALAELRSSELMLRDYMTLADGSFGCLVREREQASDLRDKWAKEADAEARQHARAGSWQRARAAASRALALERAMSPERVATMMLACQRLGLGVRAEGYLRMARQSRGEDFAAQTEAALRKLEAEVSGQILNEPEILVEWAAEMLDEHELDPYEPRALDALDAPGRPYERISEWNRAIESMSQLTRSVDDPRQQVELFCRMGKIQYGQLQDSEAAEANFLRGLAIDGSHVPTIEALVKLYRDRGDWLKAAQMIVRTEGYTPVGLDKVYDAAPGEVDEPSTRVAMGSGPAVVEGTPLVAPSKRASARPNLRSVLSVELDAESELDVPSFILRHKGPRRPAQGARQHVQDGLRRLAPEPSATAPDSPPRRLGRKSLPRTRTSSP